jgi:hypothetical protein
MMDDSAKPVEEVVATSGAITADLVHAKWPELAKCYQDKPRLFSMLSTTRLKVVGDADGMVVTFRVENEAQKDWVVSKLLHDLEGRFRRIMGSPNITLGVDVTPDDAPQQRIYMPSDKAKVLMADNAEVNAPVTDLKLEIK